MLKQTQKTISSGGFLALALFCGTALLPLNAEAQAPEGKTVVLADKVAMRRNTVTKKYVGRLAAVEDVVLQARISGTLEKICFKEGTMVKKGDLLFEIEDTVYRANVKNAQAGLKQLEAELDYANKNYERQISLKQDQIVSESVMEEAIKLKATTKARYDEADAALILAQNNLDYTKIYSPITGVIGKSTYTVGNYITPNSGALAEVVQISPVYVRFAISEPDCLNLFGSVAEMKKNAELELRTSDRKIYGEKGHIALADNMIDPQTGTLMLWGAFDNKDLKLIPGGLVDVYISRVSLEERAAVKPSALISQKNGFIVYKVGADGTIVPVPVTLAEMSGGMQLVNGKLKDGDVIVVDGTHKVKPGDKPSLKFAEAKNATPPEAKQK